MEYKISATTIKGYMRKMGIKRAEVARLANITDYKVKNFLDRDRASDETRQAILTVFTDKLHILEQGQQSKKFTCSPPQSCFKCPYSDCVNSRVATLEEQEYNNIRVHKDYVGSGDVAGVHHSKMFYSQGSNYIVL